MSGKSIAAALLAAGFVAGAAQLFVLRFEAGDVYPAYSSLRADPLGAMALYESLASLPGASAARHMAPPEKLHAGGGVVFYMGAGPNSFRLAAEKQLAQLESWTKGGARLVIVFQPQPREEKLPPGQSAVEKRWGVRLAQLAVTPVEIEDEQQGPASETLLYFDDLDAAWSVLRSDDGRPAAIVRTLGEGSVALVANAYLLSNQALLEQRDSDLIASLIAGPAPRFTFDEYHFGIRETGSVGTLGRKYGLEGLAAGLLLLAVLFLWKNSSSFLPPRENTEAAAEGRSAASALVNMLRRGVEAKTLPALCVAEWRKSLALGTYCSKEKLARVDRAASAAGGDPLSEYRAVSRILAEREIG